MVHRSPGSDYRPYLFGDLKLFRPTAIHWFVARRDGGMARDGGSRFTLERYPLG
jgi:hypothetical protein